ncbi:Ig-like domain-containing protein [Salmonella enterica]
MNETMVGLRAMINEPKNLQQSSFPAPDIRKLNESIKKSPLPQVNTATNLPELGNKENAGHQSDPPYPATWLAPKMAQAGQLLSSENVSASSINFARNVGEGMITQQINDWLNQKGTSRVTFGTDKLITGDLLLPLIDREDYLFFSQFGLHSNDARNFANLGVGFRQHSNGWMYGVNSFYDFDYTGNNARVGIGGEAWTDYLKLAVNAYYGLTSWHQSPLKSMEDYEERPAKGVDLRAEGWLPSLPQFGAKLRYERYFGEDILLGTASGPDALKDDPQALTLGLTYTPVPLLTLSGERSLGDINESRLFLNLNYRFGVPLWQQLDPAWVDVQRSLVGSKYDFVDRNYEIVMQYRKQVLIALSLPAKFTAEAGDIVNIPISVTRAKHGIDRIQWSASANFTANGGSWRQLSLSGLEVHVPAYIFNRSKAANPAQSYTLTAVAIDKNGNRSAPASTVVEVMPSAKTIQQLNVTPGVAQPADNNHLFTISAKAIDRDGKPLAAQHIRFDISHPVRSRNAAAITLFAGDSSDNSSLSVNTDGQGVATVNVKSRSAGEATVVATMDNGNSSSAKVSFVADATTAKLADLVVVTNNAIADGKQANELRATVTDVNGNPLENYAVDFSASNGAIPQSSNIAMTDRSGHATLRLTSTHVATSTITVNANSTTLSKTVDFIFDLATVGIVDSSVTQDALADGVDNNIMRVKVADANNNPVAGMSIQFVPQNPVNVTPAQMVTDQQGIAQAVLTSRRAGTFTVTATRLGTSDTTKVETRFIADENTIQLDDATLQIDPDGAVANGIASNGIAVTVADANGNPLAGKEVIFSVEQGAALSTLSAMTDNAGKASVTVTSKKAGGYMVTATVGKNSVSKKTTFVADSKTAQILPSNLLIKPDRAPANGATTDIATAIVTDAYGNRVAGAKVAFIVSPSPVTTDLPSLTTVQETTDVDGKAIASLTSLRSGRFPVTASVNGTSASYPATFIGDAATAAISSVALEGTTTDKVANGTDNFIFKTTVRDINGNPVSGASVKWTQNKGAAVTIDTDSVTDDDGIAVATLQSTHSEVDVVQVTASLDGIKLVDADKTVNFAAQLVQLNGAVWGNGVVWGSTRPLIVPGAVVKLYQSKGDSQPAYSVTTNASGNFVLQVKQGRYVVEVSSPDFLPYETTLDLTTVTSFSQDFTITQRLNGARARIVLTWGQTPINLDSHLMVPPPASAPNGGRLHVSTSDKAPAGADASLYKDGRDGGPEEITVKVMHPGSYCYSVLNARPDTGTSMSQAKVTLTLADGTEYNWDVDKDSGSVTDLLWYVFKINVAQNGDVSIQSVDQTTPGSSPDFDGC